MVVEGPGGKMEAPTSARTVRQVGDGSYHPSPGPGTCT